MPNTSSSYDALNWIHTTSTEHLCGFASFLPLIELLIKSPHLYYGVGAPRNVFIVEYEKALEFTNYENTSFANKEQEMIHKANALKVAFANCMKRDTHSPLLSLFGLVFIQSTNPTSNEPELRDHIVKMFFERYGTTLRNIYAEYQQNVDDNLLYDDELTADEKIQIKEAQYADGAAFVNYIKLAHNQFLEDSIEFFCEKIADPNSLYAARETDMSYIARLIGCIRNLIIYKVLGNDNTINEIPAIINPNGCVDMALRNSNFHWQPALLSLPEPIRTEPAHEAIQHRSTEISSRSDEDLVQQQLYSYPTMLYCFSRHFLDSQIFKKFYGREDSEFSRIDVLGKDFKETTLRVNKLLDQVNQFDDELLAEKEQEIDQTLKQLCDSAANRYKRFRSKL